MSIIHKTPPFTSNTVYDDTNFSHDITEFESNILNSSVLVGSIIAIMPNINMTKVINDEYWKLCDGTTGITVTYPDGTTYDDGINNFDLPDLTDDRFLMGVSAGVSSGGSNSLSDHKHSTYDTDLNLVSGATSGITITACAINTGACAPTSTLCSPCTSSNGLHCHSTGFLTIVVSIADGCYDRYSLSDAVATASGGGSRHAVASHSHTVGNHSHTLNHSHTMTQPTMDCSTATGTIGTSATSDVALGTTENRPQYFPVKYYMKIK